MNPTTDTVTRGPFKQGVWKLNVLEMGDTETALKRALAYGSPSKSPCMIVQR